MALVVAVLTYITSTNRPITLTLPGLSHSLAASAVGAVLGTTSNIRINSCTTLINKQHSVMSTGRDQSRVPWRQHSPSAQVHGFARARERFRANVISISLTYSAHAHLYLHLLQSWSTIESKRLDRAAGRHEKYRYPALPGRSSLHACKYLVPR
jgi:hypothetical protein